MVKNFDRYVLQEIASPFGIGLLVYSLTLLVNQILRLSKVLISKGASIGTVLQILLYLMPDLLSFTIPMSALMGVLAAMSRMSTDSEIVACRTMGISNFRILRPILMFSALTWLISSWLIMYLAPEANYRFDKLYTSILLSQTVYSSKPGTFNQDIPFYTLYFRENDRDSSWKDVFLYAQTDPKEDAVIFAQRGKFVHNQAKHESFLVLFDGVMHSFPKQDPRKYSRLLFSQKNIQLYNLLNIKQTRRSTQLLFPELLRKRRQLPGDIMLQIEFHKKFALPFACLALGLLGLALGISTKKGGKTSGFTISLGIIFIYYVMMTAFQNMVMKRLLSPFWGSWLPNFFLLGSGALLYWYSAKEKEIKWDWLLAAVYQRKKKRPRPQRRTLLVLRIPKLRLRPIKILDVYVLRKFFLIFFLIFFALMLAFYVINVIELIDNAIENHVPLSIVLNYNYYATPDIVLIVLPITVLTTVLLAYSLMSKNNEVIAVQVSGISLYRLAIPALLIGLLMSGLTFWIQERILPEASKQAAYYLDIIYNRKPLSEVEYTRNWVIGKNNEIYFYSYYEPLRQRYVQFNILYTDANFSMYKRITARYAFWSGTNKLQLLNGFIRRYQDQAPVSFQRFGNMTLPVAEDRHYFTQTIRYSAQMNIRELREYIALLKNKHSETLRYEAQMYYNYAFPLSALVMALIAIPFSFTMGSRGTFFGIGMAITISIVYWGALGLFNSLGMVAVLPPAVSAFAPLFIFTAAALCLFPRIKT